MKKIASKRKPIKKKFQNSIRKIRIIKKKAKQKRLQAQRRNISKSRVKNELPKKEISHLRSQPKLALTEKESIEVSKFTAVEILPQPTLEYNLPLRYHDNRITALARDPWWIHVYWDISETKISEIISKIPLYERENLTWVLRVYDVSGVSDFNGKNAHSYFDIEIDFRAFNWYINVNNPQRAWCVEIGVRTAGGKFFAMARSNIAMTPYFGISHLIDEEWALGDEEYYKVLGVYDLGKSSLERRKKLEEILKGQISSGAFSGGISSLFSLREKKKEKKFFLEVATELILYGRTEPTATVSVCGKKINLRDDGTFSLRYALSEGDFRFDVVSTSQDKEHTIKIVPAVKRYTIK